jgi:hypothetical protein
MLSKGERQFLEGSKQVEDNYRYYLIHQIKSKIQAFEQEDLPALLQNPATREPLLRIFTKTLREFPKTSEMEEEMDEFSINALCAEGSQSVMARGVGFEPTRPFGHRLSRPAPYQARRPRRVDSCV